MWPRRSAGYTRDTSRSFSFCSRCKRAVPTVLLVSLSVTLPRQAIQTTEPSAQTASPTALRTSRWHQHAPASAAEGPPPDPR